jgi:hypothetical protein
VYTRDILPGPGFLVADGAFSYGSYDSPFVRSNILDARNVFHYPLPRFVKDFRVKESQAFQVCSEDAFAYVDLYNAKLFTLVYVNVMDRPSRKRYSYWRFLLGSRISIPDTLLGSHTRFAQGGFEVDLRGRLDEGEVNLSARVTGHRGRPDLDFELRMDRSANSGKPLVSVLPVGLNRAIYSYRAPGPVEGSISIGGKRRRIDATTAYGMFTDQKGYFPYVTLVDWAAGMGRTKEGRLVAFSLTDNHVSGQDAVNENAVWSEGRLHPLPSIRMTRPMGPEGEWIIQDTEGMVDLSFVPEARNDVHVNAILAESDYHGPFGRYEGWVMTQDGERLKVDGLYGMGKRKRLRA